jgi:hypothetical protein
MAEPAVLLQSAIDAAGIPNVGVRVGRRDDRSTWAVDFKPEATAEQQAQAQVIIASLDLNMLTPDEQDRESVTVDVAESLLLQIAARRQKIADEMALVAPRAAQITSDLALIPERQTQITSDLTVAANASAATLKQVRDRQLNAERAILNVLGRALESEQVANEILGRALNAEDELYEQVLVPLIKKLRRL